MSYRWLNDVVRKHNAAMAALEASVPTFSVPIANSKYTAPGWLFLGGSFYCYPDVAYPWDPTVLQAIREFDPELVPVTSRQTWQYAGRGQMLEPITLVRHHLARVVRDLKQPQSEWFQCALPVHENLDLNWSPHVYAAIRPNSLEPMWHDKEVRPLSLDLSGAYLPYDWELYKSCREYFESYEGNTRTPQEFADEITDSIEAEEAADEKWAAEEGAATEREIDDRIGFDAPSELEMKQLFLGPKPDTHKPFVAVPESPEIPA